MSGSDDPCGDRVQGTAVRDVWLANASVFLAVYLEVMPLEADIIYGSFVTHSILLVLAVKAICLTLIFAPLVVYVHWNGLRALKLVQGRVAIVAVIVVCSLAHNISMLPALARQAGDI